MCTAIKVSAVQEVLIRSAEMLSPARIVRGDRACGVRAETGQLNVGVCHPCASITFYLLFMHSAIHTESLVISRLSPIRPAQAVSFEDNTQQAPRCRNLQA